MGPYGTLQKIFDTMGAFRRKTVRQDGRIGTESSATFGKIVRQFIPSHRQINPWYVTCRKKVPSSEIVLCGTHDHVKCIDAFSESDVRASGNYTGITGETLTICALCELA